MTNKILLILTVLTILYSCVYQSSHTNQRTDKNLTSDLPNYKLIFNSNKLMRLDIKMEAETWDDINNELDSFFADFPKMPMGPPGFYPPPEDMPNRKIPSPPMHKDKNEPPSGVGPKGDNQKINPSWFKCQITLDDSVFENVAIRVKGNSSLISAYNSESKKYSFKLNFSKFNKKSESKEDEYFYGFKKLNLNNNFKDRSLMREKLASDLFQKFGVPVSRSAFYTVYVDIGNGPKFHGIYTLLEQVDNTVIKTKNGSKGNLYKPEGEAATFAPNTFDTEQMNIKSNKKNADFADITKLYDVINSDLRNDDNKEWTKQLEAIFDVDIFLRWLAANRVIQNWDTYGKSYRNYYLYNNPENNKLTWIPWDNNEAFSNMSDNQSFNFENVNDGRNQWPLISNIIEVPEYKKRYNEYLVKFCKDVYSYKGMNSCITKYKNLLNEFIELEAQIGYSVFSIEDYNNAITFLKKHAKNRSADVNQYIQNQ